MTTINWSDTSSGGSGSMVDYRLLTQTGIITTSQALLPPAGTKLIMAMMAGGGQHGTGTGAESRGGCAGGMGVWAVPMMGDQALTLIIGAAGLPGGHTSIIRGGVPLAIAGGGGTGMYGSSGKIDSYGADQTEVWSRPFADSSGALVANGSTPHSNVPIWTPLPGTIRHGHGGNGQLIIYAGGTGTSRVHLNGSTGAGVAPDLVTSYYGASGVSGTVGHYGCGGAGGTRGGTVQYANQKTQGGNGANGGNILNGLWGYGSYVAGVGCNAFFDNFTGWPDWFRGWGGAGGGGAGLFGNGTNATVAASYGTSGTPGNGGLGGGGGGGGGGPGGVGVGGSGAAVLQYWG